MYTHIHMLFISFVSIGPIPQKSEAKYERQVNGIIGPGMGINVEMPLSTTQKS